MAGLSSPSGTHCDKDDSLLGRFTILRYAALGIVMLYRMFKIKEEATKLSSKQAYEWEDPFEGYAEFSDNPNVTASMVKTRSANVPLWLALAGVIFIQTEGVGLALYFATSAGMDNFTIFFAHHFSYCKYVTSVSLYTMALVTFLPTAAFAFYFQGEWYNGKPWNPLAAKTWYKSKPCFLGFMLAITICFFIVRLKLVSLLHWDTAVNLLLGYVANDSMRVGLAAGIPPMVDVLQSCLLVFASKAYERRAAGVGRRADGGQRLLPQKPYIPLKPGTLVGPGPKTDILCVSLSPIDEHFWRAGARPEGDEGILEQVLRLGPCSWWMFLSCTFCFLVPAAVHVVLYEGWPDALAAFALVAVSVSSPMCDALCVHSAEFESGPTYEWTAAAIGWEAVEAKNHIEQKHARKVVFCVDHWNVITRLVDRSVCVLLVAPSVLYFAWWRRPGLIRLAPFAGMFLVAWASCARAQQLRVKFPCGVRCVNGAWHFEDTFRSYMWWHQLWHWLLFVLLLSNALYRPKLD